MNIRLPYPPSVNNYYRHAGGLVYVTPEGKRYREEVFDILTEGNVRATLEGRLGVHIELTMPDNRRRDLDNVLKILIDSIEYGCAFHDDSQIDDLRIVRLGVSPPGCADVTIEEIGQ